ARVGPAQRDVRRAIARWKARIDQLVLGVPEVPPGRPRAHASERRVPVHCEAMPPLRRRRSAVRTEEPGAVEGCPAAAWSGLELLQVASVQTRPQSAHRAQRSVIGEAHVDRLVLELTQIDQRIDRVALRTGPERSTRVAMDTRLAHRG